MVATPSVAVTPGLPPPADSLPAIPSHWPNTIRSAVVGGWGVLVWVFFMALAVAHADFGSALLRGSLAGLITLPFFGALAKHINRPAIIQLWVADPVRFLQTVRMAVKRSRMTIESGTATHWTFRMRGMPGGAVEAFFAEGAVTVRGPHYVMGRVRKALGVPSS